MLDSFFQFLQTVNQKTSSIFNGGLFSALITLMLILVCCLLVSRLVTRFVHRFQEKHPQRGSQMQFIGHLLHSALWVLGVFGVLFQVKAFEQIAVSLLAGSGIAALCVGLASQEVLSNLVSGVFLNLFHPFSIGDRVTIQSLGVTGIIEDISLRHTVIRNFENNRILIPNSKMNSEVVENTNFSEQIVSNFLDLGISYSADIEKAIFIIQQEVQNHPDFYDGRSEKDKMDGISPVVVRVVGLGDFSVNLRTVVWAKDAGTGYAQLCDLRKTIKKRFDKEHIEIPFPCTNVYLRKEEQ